MAGGKNLKMYETTGVSTNSSRQRIIVALLFVISGVAIGCKNSNPQIIWSAEKRSPDGKMVAKASAFANGGFGMSGTPTTFVYWNWAAGSQKPTLILSLGNESDSLEDAKVEMNWLSTSHLELVYRSNRQHIAFQAVKCAGVDISLRDLASPMGSAPSQTQ
jgi:hypothetical protein